MKTFIYCRDCNEVYEQGKNAPRKCFYPDHSHVAIINERQYLKWLLSDKPVLNIKKIDKSIVKIGV